MNDVARIMALLTFQSGLSSLITVASGYTWVTTVVAGVNICIFIGAALSSLFKD